MTVILFVFLVYFIISIILYIPKIIIDWVKWTFFWIKLSAIMVGLWLMYSIIKMLF